MENFLSTATNMFPEGKKKQHRGSFLDPPVWSNHKTMQTSKTGFSPVFDEDIPNLGDRKA